MEGSNPNINVKMHDVDIDKDCITVLYVGTATPIPVCAVIPCTSYKNYNALIEADTGTIVYLADAPGPTELYIWLDDEGLLAGKRRNGLLSEMTGMHLVGAGLIMASDDDGNACSLNRDQMEWVNQFIEARLNREGGGR